VGSKAPKKKKKKGSSQFAKKNPKFWKIKKNGIPKNLNPLNWEFKVESFQLIPWENFAWEPFPRAQKRKRKKDWKWKLIGKRIGNKKNLDGIFKTISKNFGKFLYGPIKGKK